MTNIDEVARKAGVSNATVSRALRDAAHVKPSTRERVLRAVREMRYQPNLNARALAAGRDSTFGVIVSNIENPFFLDIYKSIEADARTYGYEVVLASTGYSTEQLRASTRLMIQRRVAGVATIVFEPAQDVLQQLRASGVPVVFCDFTGLVNDSTTIRVNYAMGVERIFDYLQSLGHRRFGLVGPGERLVAARQIIARKCLVDFQAATCPDTLDGGRQAARALLDGASRPTALICGDDILAVGCLRELRERGYDVPSDVSVTGFDNIALSQFCYPALTTVLVPTARIGHSLCEALLAESAGGSAGWRTMQIDAELIIRESTGLAPGSR